MLILIHFSRFSYYNTQLFDRCDRMSQTNKNYYLSAAISLFIAIFYRYCKIYYCFSDAQCKYLTLFY
jgi:hypothetical protein